MVRPGPAAVRPGPAARPQAPHAGALPALRLRLRPRRRTAAPMSSRPRCSISTGPGLRARPETGDVWSAAAATLGARLRRISPESSASSQPRENWPWARGRVGVSEVNPPASALRPGREPPRAGAAWVTGRVCRTRAAVPIGTSGPLPTAPQRSPLRPGRFSVVLCPPRGLHGPQEGAGGGEAFLPGPLTAATGACRAAVAFRTPGAGPSRGASGGHRGGHRRCLESALGRFGVNFLCELFSSLGPDLMGVL